MRQLRASGRYYTVGVDAFEVHDNGGNLAGFVAQEEPTRWSDGTTSQFWVAFRLSGKVYPYLSNSRDEAERHIRIDRRLTLSRVERVKARRAQRVKLGYATKRDAQRQKLYRAEDEAFADYPRATGRGLDTVRALADVYAKQLGLKRPPIHLKGGGRSHYNPNSRSVYLSQKHGAELDWVLTHELCHFWDNPTGVAKPWHGREFAAFHLDVVTRVLGRAWGEKLRASYVKHGVKYRAARKRELSEEQRAVLRERLAKARAAKAARSN